MATVPDVIGRGFRCRCQVLSQQPERQPSYEQLQHEYISTRGLWCIDKSPSNVDYEWIKRNAFQLQSLSGDEAKPHDLPRTITFEIWAKSPATIQPRPCFRRQSIRAPIVKAMK
jgi:hypothetical protein